MERLIQKIEAIRKEPEHIRMRYVFLSVGVSMALVLLLWMFSLYEGFRSAAENTTPLPAINLPQAPSIGDLSKDAGGKQSVTGQEFFQSEQMKKSGGSDTVTQQ
jgi:hypothetical protein